MAISKKFDAEFERIMGGISLEAAHNDIMRQDQYSMELQIEQCFREFEMMNSLNQVVQESQSLLNIGGGIL